MFIHFGLHLDRMFAKIRTSPTNTIKDRVWVPENLVTNVIKSEKLKRVIYTIYIIIVLLIAMYFLYTLTHSFQWLYAFGNGKW